MSSSTQTTLISPEQFLRYYPRFDGLFDQQPDVLRDVILWADGLIAGYCGYSPYNGGGGARTLTEQAYTVLSGGPAVRDARVLCLCVWPIVSVTSVEVDSTGVYSGDESLLVEDTDFLVDATDPILFRIGSTWPVGYRGIRTVLTAGFSAPPPALVPIVGTVVQALLDRPHLQGLDSSSVGGVSLSTQDLEQLIPAAARAALDQGFSLRGCSAHA